MTRLILSDIRLQAESPGETRRQRCSGNAKVGWKMEVSKRLKKLQEIWDASNPVVFIAPGPTVTDTSFVILLLYPAGTWTWAMQIWRCSLLKHCTGTVSCIDSTASQVNLKEIGLTIPQRVVPRSVSQTHLSRLNTLAPKIQLQTKWKNIVENDSDKLQ